MVPETSEISTNQAAKKKKRKINNCEEINYHTRDKTKKIIFPFFFTELKTYHLSYIYLQTLRYRHCWY